jgi:hypothetical protein
LPEKRNLSLKSPISQFVKKETKVSPALIAPISNQPVFTKKDAQN